jgi:hypothetical protein
MQFRSPLLLGDERIEQAASGGHPSSRGLLSSWLKASVAFNWRYKN